MVAAGSKDHCVVLHQMEQWWNVAAIFAALSRNTFTAVGVYPSSRNKRKRRIHLNLVQHPYPSRQKRLRKTSSQMNSPDITSTSLQEETDERGEKGTDNAFSLSRCSLDKKDRFCSDVSLRLQAGRSIKRNEWSSAGTETPFICQHLSNLVLRHEECYQLYIQRRMGDFNARTGCSTTAWEDVIRKHVVRNNRTRPLDQ
jgi:hypothetical protein